MLSYAWSSMWGNEVHEVVVDADLTCHTIESKQNNFITEFISLVLFLLLLLCICFHFTLHIQAIRFHLFSFIHFVSIYSFWPGSNHHTCQQSRLNVAFFTKHLENSIWIVIIGINFNQFPSLSRSMSKLQHSLSFTIWLIEMILLGSDIYKLLFFFFSKYPFVEFYSENQSLFAQCLVSLLICF